MSREHHAVQQQGISTKTGLYLGFAARPWCRRGFARRFLLPLLLRRWSLGDATACGILLLSLATTTGALLLAWPNEPPLDIARGALLTSAGAVWLGLASRDWGFAAIVVYGLGLGIAMTSTSLLVSRRFPEERRVEMMRLNLLWAAGACAGPWLALGGQALKAGAHAVRPLLHSRLAFALLGVRSRSEPRSHPSRSRLPESACPAILLFRST